MNSEVREQLAVKIFELGHKTRFAAVEFDLETTVLLGTGNLDSSELVENLKLDYVFLTAKCFDKLIRFSDELDSLCAALHSGDERAGKLLREATLCDQEARKVRFELNDALQGDDTGNIIGLENKLRSLEQSTEDFLNDLILYGMRINDNAESGENEVAVVVQADGGGDEYEDTSFVREISQKAREIEVP